jgi:tetratricopeptide (TPR) repeat protein
VLSRDERPTGGRAKALAGAALMARQSGDTTTTRLRAEEARALYVELGDSWGTANSGVLLGLADADEGDFSRARQLFDDSAGLFRDAGAEDDALFATRLLGWMYEELGDRERSRAVHEQNLGRARALGNKTIEGQTLGALAYLAVDEGRARDAVSMMKEVLRIDRDRGVHLQTTLDLSRFARALAFAGGAAAEATQLLSCAAARREDIGAGSPPPYVATLNDEAIAAIRTQLGEDSFAEAWEQGRTLTLDEAVALAVDSLG